MFCKHCGSNVAPGLLFCTKCGTKVQGTPTTIRPINTPTELTPPVYPGTAAGFPTYPTHHFPMAWYKWLIYFSLFAGAVMNAITGLLLLTGKFYSFVIGIAVKIAAMIYSVPEYYIEGSFPFPIEHIDKYLYEASPALQFLDITYGIMVVGLVVLGIYTRFALSGYKSNGPKMIVTLYVSAILVSVFRIVSELLLVISIGGKITNETMITVFIMFIPIIVNIIIAIANHSYFKKRAVLFKN